MTRLPRLPPGALPRPAALSRRLRRQHRGGLWLIPLLLLLICPLPLWRRNTQRGGRAEAAAGPAGSEAKREAKWEAERLRRAAWAIPSAAAFRAMGAKVSFVHCAWPRRG